jgi:hypothetical protein
LKKVALFSALLLVSLLGSQWLPQWMGEFYPSTRQGVLLLSMIALAFIMIHVGYEFELDRGNLRQYGWDYAVAFTAAFFPWIFVTLYFVYVMLPPDTWVLADLEGSLARGSVRVAHLRRCPLLDARGGRPECDLVVPEGPNPRHLRRSRHRSPHGTPAALVDWLGLAAERRRRGDGGSFGVRLGVAPLPGPPDLLALGDGIRDRHPALSELVEAASKMVDERVPIHIEAAPGVR